MKKPLLRMLRCESVAPFGEPVVPHVYWMLIGSSESSAASRAASVASSTASERARSTLPVAPSRTDSLSSGALGARRPARRSRALEARASTSSGTPDWRSTYSSSWRR